MCKSRMEDPTLNGDYCYGIEESMDESGQAQYKICTSDHITYSSTHTVYDSRYSLPETGDDD